MKLDDIHNIWADDCRIDESSLDKESLKIPFLHSKYYKIFSAERFRLKQLKEEHKKLLLEKSEFLTQGPATGTKNENGWEMPTRGKVLKAEVEKYLDADQAIIDSNLRIAYQQEKVSLLESIIDSLNKRSFMISNAINFLKWTNGG